MSAFLERARSRKPITWLTILGVLLLPAAIGGILVTALQNPTERLDEMTAAIVNLDDPVEIDGQTAPLGRQLASGLVEGSDDLDSNLSWVISNEDDAADGLADGTYQAVVTIPESFSKAATSAGNAISGEGDPEQATIQVTTPDDALLADDLITNQIATAATKTMGDTLSESTLENVLVGFTTIGDQIGDAATGALKLAKGARSAAKGAGELPDGAGQLADGAGKLNSGAAELSSGLGTLAGKTREVADGASQLGSGLTDGAGQLQKQGLVPQELLDGASDLAKGTAGLQQAADGTQQATAGVQEGAGKLKTGLDGLAAQCSISGANATFCEQLTAVADGATDLKTGADTAATLSKTTADVAKPTAAGAKALSSGVATLAKKAPAAVAKQLRDAGKAASALGSGLDQLAGGIDQSKSGADQLASGAGQLKDGADKLADGSDELVDGLDELASGTGDLAGGLRDASEQLPSFSDQESSSLASVVADPVTADAGDDTIFGPTAIPLLAAVVLWFGGLASFVVLRAHTAHTLTSRRSSASLALRGFAPAAIIGAVQGLLVALIVQFVASYDAGTWWAFAGTAVVAGIAFAAVNQALVAVFGGIGRWLAVLVGVLAVATGLISTIPGWLASLGGILPTQPAFAGLIEGSGGAIAALIVWGVLSLVVTTVAVALRRTASSKSVMAPAGT